MNAIVFPLTICMYNLQFLILQKSHFIILGFVLKPFFCLVACFIVLLFIVIIGLYINLSIIFQLSHFPEISNIQENRQHVCKLYFIHVIIFIPELL